MRTIIELHKNQLENLDALMKAEHLSRAELIRRAIDNYIQKKAPSSDKKSAFGIWRKKHRDALAYEKKIRKEWEC